MGVALNNIDMHCDQNKKSHPHQIAKEAEAVSSKLLEITKKNHEF